MSYPIRLFDNNNQVVISTIFDELEDAYMMAYSTRDLGVLPSGWTFEISVTDPSPMAIGEYEVDRIVI